MGIDKIGVKHIAICKPQHDTAVEGSRQQPASIKFPAESMRPQAGDLVDLVGTCRIVEDKQCSRDASWLILLQPACSVLLKQPPKASMPEASDH